MLISILVRIIQRYLGPVHANNNNLGNKYQNWININSTGSINRSREIQGLISRFWVQLAE